MPKGRVCGAARAKPGSFRCKPLNATRAARMAGAAVTPLAAKGASLNDAVSQPGPDAELLALLVTLKQQNDLLAAIEEEARRLPRGITLASRDQERRLKQVLDRRTETLDGVIKTRACTPAGMRVKAEALRLVTLEYTISQDGELVDDIAQYGRPWERLALSLARDVLAWRTTEADSSDLRGPPEREVTGAGAHGMTSESGEGAL